MNVVYMVKLDKEIPNKYIGSKMHCNLVDGVLMFRKHSHYWGSSSNTVYQQIISENLIPKRLIVLEEVHSDSAYDVLMAEVKWQKHFDVVANPEFYNKSIANVNNYSDPAYATYKNVATDKRARLPRNHPDVLNGLWVGVTKGTKMSPEWIEKMRSRMIGSGNPFYGRKHTDESRKLIKEHHVDYHPPEEFISWFTDNVARVPRTKEWKSRIGSSHKGKNTIINPKTMEKRFESVGFMPEGFVTIQKYRSDTSPKKRCICEICNKEYFVSNKASSKYCSKECIRTHCRERAKANRKLKDESDKN